MNRIVALALVVLLVGCSRTPQEKAQSTFRDGVRQLDNGRVDQADSTFRRLMAEAPASPLGLFGTGLVQERQCQTVDALGTYLQVIKLERTFSPALMAMGRVFRRLGEFDLAATAYQDCSALPDSPAVAIVGYAVAQCDNGWPAAALGAVQAADSLGADKKLTGLLRARILVLQGKRDSADVLFQKTFPTTDESPLALSLAADYLETRGAIDSAILISARSANRKNAGYDQLVEHFQRCLRNRYFWEARQVIKHIGDDSTDLARLGMQIPYYLAQGDNFHANKKSDQFMRRGNNSIMSLLFESDVRKPVGDIVTVSTNARNIPGMALSGNDTTAFVRYLLGLVALRYADLGDPAEVAIQLTSSSGFLKDRRNYRLAWLEQVYKSGALELFDPSLQQMEQAHGIEADWLTGFGDIFSDATIRKYDLAEQYYRRALQNDALYAPALRALTGMYLHLGEFEKAVKTFDDFRALCDANVDLQLERALCLAASGQADAGAADFMAALPQLRGDLVRVERMSRLLEAKGRSDLDSNLIATALALNPRNPDALLLAAMRSNDYGNGRRGLDYAEQGLTLEPSNVDLAVQKARGLCLTGDKQGGYALFEDLLKKENGEVDVNLYFSSILASNREQLPRAANMARGAHGWEQGELRTTANLAYVYLQAEQYNLAADEARIMTVIHPAWSETQYLYGAALFGQKKKEARDYLTKALELGLPAGFRDRAQEMLAQR